MRTLLAIAAMFLALGIAGPSDVQATGFKHILKPGRYAIEVIAEDPRSGLHRTVKRVERCLQPQEIANHVIFEMMSDTPASGCERYEICAGELRTGFMAQCTPTSTISAVGMFALEPDQFRGRIEVKIGNEELSNVEIQYGTRLGDCETAPPGPPDEAKYPPKGAFLRVTSKMRGMGS